jgi:hypothetical protein
MLSATELRIGNLVNYDTAEGDVFTNVIDWQDLKWLSEDEQGFNLVHNPILLTEEWLLKFGFKKYPDCRDTFQQVYYDSYQLDIDRFTIISFSIQQQNKSLIKCNFDRGYRSEDNKKNYYIKHVHQLQNLYFALTNEELTLIK